jgi:hypothetical protein
MHLRKACKELSRLIDDGPHNTLKYVQVEALLLGFDRQNHDSLDGHLLDSYASEKIHHVRNWFSILCGIGEDGGWTEKHLKEILHGCVGKLGMLVSENGIGLYTPAMAHADRLERDEQG